MRVVEVRVHEPEQLRYLGSLDLYPGARVEITDAAPFEGPLSLRVNGEPRVISRLLAQQLYVEEAGSPEEPASPPY